MVGKYPSIFQNAVLWAPLLHSAGYTNDIDEFPIIPSGVTVTNNGSWTKSDLGNNKSVLVFDGSTNYISLTDDVAWDIYDGDFTISAWVKFSSVSVSNGVFGQRVDLNNYVALRWITDSNVILLNGYSGGTVNFNYTCPFTPIANIWYYLVIMKSGSACLMYIDDINQTVTELQAWRNTTNIAAPLTVGLGGAVNMSGCIYDLRIYKGRALTLPEIKLLVKITHPVTGSGMIPGPYDYWRLS